MMNRIRHAPTIKPEPVLRGSFTLVRLDFNAGRVAFLAQTVEKRRRKHEYASF